MDRDDEMLTDVSGREILNPRHVRRVVMDKPLQIADPRKPWRVVAYTDERGATTLARDLSATDAAQIRDAAGALITPKNRSDS